MLNRFQQLFTWPRLAPTRRRPSRRRGGWWRRLQGARRRSETYHSLQAALQAANRPCSRIQTLACCHPWLRPCSFAHALYLLYNESLGLSCIYTLQCVVLLHCLPDCNTAKRVRSSRLTKAKVGCQALNRLVAQQKPNKALTLSYQARRQHCSQPLSTDNCNYCTAAPPPRRGSRTALPHKQPRHPVSSNTLTRHTWSLPKCCYSRCCHAATCKAPRP